ncbi:MAG: glycosyltransferase family 4 protein [Verrucomicrobiae bacterium]|nr:glycosyltransferase family 4 protein [Verrucomicrobiae bacterium]
MTVLHVLGAEEDTGGILSVLRNLQAATRAKDCKHVVLVNRRFKETRRPGLAYRYSRYLVAESPQHFSLLIRAIVSLPEVIGLVWREGFEVVHAHSRGAFPIACMLAVAGLGVVFTNHAYARRTGMYRAARCIKNLHTVCLTPNMARHYGLPTGSTRVHIISACCADRFFELPLVQRKESCASGEVIRLVGLGNIVRWKNWHLVLEALSKLSKDDLARVRFDHWGPVASDPDSQNYHSELIKKTQNDGLSEHCSFHGPSHSVEDVLARADWFVIPSTNEPCSVALIEALAMGVPAIASASGGNLDIVRAEQTGLFFEPGSAESLAQCLRRIVRGDVAMCDGVVLRESVRHRSASAVAAQYLTLYEQIARRKQNREARS